MADPSAFWEAFHGGETHFTGRPNAALVAEVADLEPGTALDLGCAKGTDAIWLPRARILRDAAARVAPGGTLLVVGHPPQPQHPDRDLPGVAGTLELLPGWPVVTAAQRHDAGRGRDDVVVRLRRP